MTQCRRCSKSLPDESRFCPACGAPLDPSSATPTQVAEPRAATSPTSFPSISGAGDSRFLPGTVVAGRYRVFGLLGKGGMGEVYRADDLKLGQPVALKFLPEALSRNQAKLERFFNEARVARQVSHPHVCRVYDVGEVDGHHFLSMEYIDGEDLASLLRRIGRLPGDKAVEIGRQLCAGLAAAHDKGVLHRDLKPANVMIDGRGRARITDFGLAGLADEIQGAEIRAGTPAYMAPEQLSGRAVSVLSDIYSLGLVLYEIFTGKPALRAASLEELVKLHETSDVASPSSITRDLDPAVERVILRCLDKDPAARPASAMAVAAALPGGDPLAAALAAGETPSPEMVAAAGEVGALKPFTAGILLAAFLAALVVIGILNPRVTLMAQVPVTKPPEVLAEKSRELLSRLGYTATPADTAYGYDFRSDIKNWIEREDASPRRWEKLSSSHTSPVVFWYRESPRNLIPRNPARTVLIGDPPDIVSGMATLHMNMEGHLIEMHVVPPQAEEELEAQASEPDWPILFAAANLDQSAFSSARSRWTSPAFSDKRAAWEGRFPDSAGAEARIEAAAYRGKPVYFEVVGP